KRPMRIRARLVLEPVIDPIRPPNQPLIVKEPPRRGLSPPEEREPAIRDDETHRRLLRNSRPNTAPITHESAIGGAVIYTFTSSPACGARAVLAEYERESART